MSFTILLLLLCLIIYYVEAFHQFIYENGDKIHEHFENLELFEVGIERELGKTKRVRRDVNHEMYYQRSHMFVNI